MPVETSQTLHRGLLALEELTAHPGGLSVSELAARLGINRTIAYRLVATLEQHTLVRKDDQGRFYVGLGVLRLASAVHPVLRDLAIPLLRSLADQLGCTAHLTVAEGDEGLAVAVVEPSWTDFHVSYRVGSRHPLTLGAAGRAILLGREAGARAVRPAGPAYVTTTGELQSGARGLAAPVLGVAGIEASVGIVTMGDLDPAAAADPVVVAAAQLAADLS